MISHELQLFYVHPPKTAGHSIGRFFLDRGLASFQISNGKKIYWWHATGKAQRELLGKNADMYYSFATVRNPWDRWLSEYLWQAAKTYDTQLSTTWGNKEISFADFCRSDHNWYPQRERNNGHLSDQSSFLFDNEDRLLVKDLIRFEHFQRHFEAVCQRIGLPTFYLPRLNKTEHGFYWKYYTSDLVEIVGNRFERDIRLLGYRFKG